MEKFDRLILTVIASILLAIGVVIALGDLAGTPLPDALPADGSHPPATTTIRMDFPQAMEAESVESRFKLEPEVEGAFRWDGTTLIFDPATALTAGQTYTAILESGALSDAGRAIKSALAWSFTPREPAILYLGPVDAPVRSLWRVPASGGEPVEVFAAEFGVYDFDISPDGEHLAVTVFNEDLSSDIWLMNADGSGASALINCQPGACSAPAWSPGGILLAYERTDAIATGVPGPSRVWLYDIETGETAPVYEDNQILGFGPRWSPDGARLAFFDASSQAIRVLPIAGGDAVVIPNQMGEVGSFAPDGMQMVYVDIRQVGQQFFAELWIADFREGGGLQPMVSDAEEDQSPAWSPSGEWIAFGRRLLDRSDGWGSQITLYDPLSESLRGVTDDPGYNNTQFTWSPDGRKILLQRFDLNAVHATPELWLYELESDSLTWLAENGFGGAWLP